MTAEPYAYWHNALNGQFDSITENDSQLGFYRVKALGGIWIPVAIWSEQDMVWVQVGKEDPTAAEGNVRDAWMRCASHPITEKAYRIAIATNQWPGDAPAQAGHNAPPPEGQPALDAAIADKAAEAEAWLAGRRIETQADADKCETLANEFLKLKKIAEAEHTAEKKPHLDAGRAVDAKYKPLIDTAAAVARKLKAAATGYLLARQAEKQRAAAQAIAKGESATRVETRATTSGNSGRKLALRTHKYAQIEDWDAAIQFFRENPALREVVQSLADKCAQVGATVPGVTFKEEQRAA